MTTTQPDQEVAIRVPGIPVAWVAQGGPELIAARLAEGKEVIVNPIEEQDPLDTERTRVGPECALRLTPGLPYVLTYSEAVER